MGEQSPPMAACGAVGSCTVTIEPTDLNGTALAVFDGDGVQVRRQSARTDSTGTLTLDVTPTDEIVGTGRYYTVTITDSDGGEWTFLIEKSDTSQTLYQALREDPEDLGLAVGLDNLVDGDTAVRTTDTRLTDARDPLPLDGVMVPCGHSIVLGTGSTLSSTTSLNGDSRQAVGGWVRRLAGQHPDRYFVIRNAGIGGDPTGALCELTEAAGIGDTEVTVSVTYGLAESTVAGGIYVGGYPDGEAKFPTDVTDNGDGTWTLSGFTALASAHAVGDEVGWGVHGRLQATVLDYNPGTVLLLLFTNDANKVSDGTFTAAELVGSGIQVAERCRTAGSEPLFLEELPRSTYQQAVYQIVEALRYRCRTDGYHLVPLYDYFSGGDGDWADPTWTDDGIHPSDLGHELIARQVHRYLTSVPLRIATTPLGTYDGAASPQNLIANSCFLTGASAGGGVVATGATWSPFIFSGTCVPSLEAPATEPDDNIVGQWQKLTASSLNGNASIDFPVATQTVGDLVYIAARIKTEDLSGGAKCTVQFLTGSFTIDLAYELVDDMDLTIVATTSTLSANSLSKLRMQFNGGSGSLWVANPIMQNLTDLDREP